MEIAIKAAGKLREKKGASMITPVIAILVAIPFLILLSDFIYIYSMITGLSDYIQEAVIQTAASNAYNAYNGVREGNSTAHYYAGGDNWSEMVSTAEVQTRLKDMLQMNRSGNRLTKEKDGVLRYALTGMDTHCQNVSVGSNDNDVTLTFKTTATVELPMYFMGARMTVRKQISLTSYYTPLF